MITVDVTIKGLTDLTGLLSKIAEKVKSPQSGMRKAGEYLLDFYQNKVFPSQGSALGGAVWAPLASSTLTQKAKKYPGRGILVASGNLQRGFRMMAGPTYLKIFNVVPYGQFHMTGTSKMPQRMYMGLDDQQTGKVVGIIVEDVIKSII